MKLTIYCQADANKSTHVLSNIYPCKFYPSALWYGNNFVVIALAQGRQTVAVDGIPHREPYVVARCMHVWKTGGYYEIADFPHTSDGYYRLEQETYCAK